MSVSRQITRLLAALLLCCAASQANATLTIEITGGVEGALPIAIVPFGVEGQAPPLEVSSVVAADLARSGRFAPLPKEDLVATPHDGAQVKFADWRLLGVENLVVGSLRPAGPGRYEVRFQLFDVFKGVQLTGYSIPTATADLRRTAHQVADIIYETLTGERGAFTTRIAYVTALRQGDAKTSYHLNIADADGYNEQIILESPQPLMSPAWSPDGKFLAMTLSRDGNPEIYTLNLETRALNRVTRSAAIETEPAWSPDGRRLAFTSDRGGQPQVYLIEVRNGQAQGDPRRVTFEGEYNARASFSPDGHLLTLVHGGGGRFQIAVLEIASGILQVMTDSRLDESPSFAPNGSQIIYATQSDGRAVLAAVSVDGRVHQRLALQQGEVREPAWSPFGQ